MRIEVKIDTERCSGHGRCYAVAPDVFKSDDNGYGVVGAESFPHEVIEAARLGASNCPEGAITVRVLDER